MQPIRENLIHQQSPQQNWGAPPDGVHPGQYLDPGRGSDEGCSNRIISSGWSFIEIATGLPVTGHEVLEIVVVYVIPHQHSVQELFHVSHLWKVKSQSRNVRFVSFIILYHYGWNIIILTLHQWGV